MIKTVFTRVGGGVVRIKPFTVIRNLSSSGKGGHGHLPGGGTLSLLKSQQKIQFGSSSGFLKCLGGVRDIGIRGVHDQRKKGDDELLGFLEEEIATEMKMQRSTSVPATFQGFSVKVDQSDITLTKNIGGEDIIISANVNHSVDTEYGAERGGDPGPTVNQGVNEPGGEGMRSKPSFDVEIKKGNQTMCLNCSFIQPEAGATGGGQAGGASSGQDFVDIFVIDEVSLYDGKGGEADYAVAGDILDGYLYDLLMNLLEDRGINNEFVDKFSELCTDYEHNLYIELLAKMQKFFK
ncbi:unnamed protein product [Orchesella dallaii]|uniref:Complement component 1 Q subcomponent-binding protein, mitochondrial n=1 Tax=Orchesella dallaii TaxID=48710 RepID=A0ABP1S8N0_9HEXA